MRVKVAREAVAFARANPHLHDQDSWRCGSTRCIAGIIAELGGARWQKPEDDGDNYVVAPDGRVLPVWDYAAERLNVDPDELDEAFDAGQSIDDVEAALLGVADR